MAGPPSDSKNAITGRLEDKSEVSPADGAMTDKRAGVRPSSTFALAKFCCSFGSRSS